MAGSVGNITTDITREGLVFNMDPANRASYPKTGNKTFNTLNATISGSFINDVQFITEPISSSCFGFDGVDDYIDCGNNSSLQMTGNFTLSSWFNMGNYTNTYPRLMGKSNSSNNRCNYGIGFYGNKPAVIANDDGSWVDDYASATTLSTYVWYNIIGVNDGSNFLLYVNGTLDNTTSVSDFNIANAASATSGDSLLIGVSIPSTGFYKGNIGLIQIYNRALSVSEVLNNYNALKGRFGL